VQQNVSAIPRTSRVERLSENIEIFDFELSEDEMARVSALASPKGRLTDFGFAPKWD
jgi:2,5-diketo-D-gluconate reductase B